MIDISNPQKLTLRAGDPFIGVSGTVRIAKYFAGPSGESFTTLKEAALANPRAKFLMIENEIGGYSSTDHAKVQATHS